MHEFTTQHRPHQHHPHPHLHLHPIYVTAPLPPCSLTLATLCLRSTLAHKFILQFFASYEKETKAKNVTKNTKTRKTTKTIIKKKNQAAHNKNSDNDNNNNSNDNDDVKKLYKLQKHLEKERKLL